MCFVSSNPCRPVDIVSPERKETRSAQFSSDLLYSAFNFVFRFGIFVAVTLEPGFQTVRSFDTFWDCASVTGSKFPAIMNRKQRGEAVNVTARCKVIFVSYETSRRYTFSFHG